MHFGKSARLQGLYYSTLACLVLMQGLTARTQAQSAAPSRLTIQPGTISTIAGQQNATDYTEGQSATTAGIYSYGMAVDQFGNVYVISNRTQTVSVIPSGNGGLANLSLLNPAAPKDPSDSTKPDQARIKGQIYTFAGQYNNPCFGQPGCGDGVPATNAQLGNPQDAAVDAAGNVYVVDTVTGIRRVDAQTGVMTTLPGVTQSYSNIAINASGSLLALTDNSANVYEVSAAGGAVTQIVGGGSAVCSSAPCGDGGLATNAQMFSSGKPAFDAMGNLYIADLGYFGGEIRRVDAATHLISSIGISGGGPPPGVTPAPDAIGDGGPVAASFPFAISVYTDQNSNLFVSAGTFGSVREVNATTSVIQAVAGVSFGYNPNACGTIDANGNLITQCGDGGPADNATFGYPVWYQQDGVGNGYIADFSATTNLIRFVTANTSNYAFGPQPLGQQALAMETATTYDPSSGLQLTMVPLNYTLNNSGGSPLTISSLTISSPDFGQVPSGGMVRGSAVPGLKDCAPGTTLAPNAACAIGVSFTPIQDAAESATLTIASNASNAVSGANVVTLSGSGIKPAGTRTQTIQFMAPPTVIFGATVPLTATASSNLPVYYTVSGPATLNKAGTALTPTGLGAITVTAYQFGDTQYAEASPVTATVTVNAQPLTVKADSFFSVPIGGPLPPLTYSVFLGATTNKAPAGATTGSATLTTTATASSAPGTYPITIAPGSLAAANGYTLTPLTSADDGTLVIGGSTPETVNFPAVGPVKYGVAPILLTAVAVDANHQPVPSQNIVYAVTSGPATVSGAMLTISGAGTVNVTATQPGDNKYAGASATQSIIVGKAPLDVKPSDVSVVLGQPIPVLTASFTGFVNGDSQASAITGAPTLSTTATSSSPVGSYPITLTSLGTLATVNYSFTVDPAPGTLSIVQGHSQTISFLPLANQTYGVAPITLLASASSGLGVSFQVASGPATVSGNTLSVRGAGTISVTAIQSGFGTYGAAAPVTQSFVVAPAVLTFTAGDLTRPNNTTNPDLTNDWSNPPAGLVNGDTGSAFSGAPSLSTTAEPGSPAGVYPINIAAGSLAAANYTFAFTPGTLTVTNQGPIPGFTLVASPPTLSVLHGGLGSVRITLTPVNYYAGSVNLSCGQLPANVICTFSSASLAADGSGAAAQTILTINTGPTATVGSNRETQRANPYRLAEGMAYAALCGFCLTRRNRLPKIGVLGIMISAAALSVLSLSGCGSTSTPTNTGVAASGTSTIMIQGASGDGAITSNIPLVLTVN